MNISFLIFIITLSFPLFLFAGEDESKPSAIFNSKERLNHIKKKYDSLLDKKYILLPHSGIYLIPFSYNFNPNNKSYSSLTSTPELSGRGKYNKNLETELQISFMFLITRNIFNFGFNIFAGYTHRAWWQVYNKEWSRPFRETNYEPEIFARKIFDEPKSIVGGKLVAYDFGLIHQSNGQVQELSRSWNRIFLRFAIIFHETFINTSIWYRLPDAIDKDDNHDIHHYLGYGSIEINQNFFKSRMQLKIIPGTKKQGLELSCSYPWNEGLRYFIKVGYGYGLSLIDYKNEEQRIGIGMALSDLFSQ